MQRRVDIDKQGSSPRVWGQEWVALYDRHTMRIIPTRVGTSKIKFTIFFLNQDHPHACGDKPESHIRTTQQKGSSPRVWGQASALNDGGAERGIIPTRVGTSLDLYVKLSKLKDHPHACGDKVCAVDGYHNTLGSSPRVWGQDSEHCAFGGYCGIIPTRVGTSTPLPPVISSR